MFFEQTKKKKTIPVFQKWITFFALLISIFSVAQQGNGVIKGNVLTSDHHPAEDVVVNIVGTSKSVITDDQGNFTLHKLPAGNYTLQLALNGYETLTRNVTVSSNQTAQLTVQLETSLKQLQEVVVVSGAQKFAQKKSEYVARLPISNLENPQVYTVVPKELFQEQIATDFRSALTTAPGLSNVTQSVGSGGVGLSLRMRGFSGASAAGSIRNGMNTNWVTMTDPVNLESIEVIKGPSATLFGSTLTTYGGLINRVTKKPFEFFKGEVSYTTGSWALSRTTIDLNTPVNEDKTMLFRINAALDHQKTWQDYGKSKTFMVAPSFTYHINDRLTADLDLEVYNGSRNATYTGLGNFNPDNSTFKSFNDLNFDFKKSYTTDELQSEAKTTNVFTRFTYKMSDSWLSQTNFSNSFTDNKANYLFLLINNPAAGETIPVLQRRLMNINSTFKTTQIQQNFINTIEVGNFKNRLLLGADYTYVSTNDNRWTINNYDASAGNPLTPINGNAPFINYDKYRQFIAAMPAPSVVNNRDLRTTSIYASDVVSVYDRLHVMFSGRFDHNENKITNYNQNAFSPKLGIVYQIVKDKVSLFSNYMNGFANTGSGETAPGVVIDFKPEQANQWEAGVKVELIEGKLNGTLSYYDIAVKDKIRWDGNYQIQDGTQKSTGFEADLIANPFKGFHIIMGYGYNDSQYTSGTANGKTPYAAPKNVANLWMSYKILNGKVKGLGFGFGGNTQSDSFANDANTFTVDGYTVLNGTVFYENPKFRLGLKLNNIANTEYWTTDYWSNMMPTRHFVANFTFKF
ncbi:TonB-dependent receptor [Flavobacterium agrisoli]|uniref:TonB-dependent receptor n=1 Tax=Flavobacterium agrisoli TaxID=2793066 RepID=A0A934UJ92_9FLAO|nr:TonB-dependent receptor [Flavobacterium agrisoli]MBK0369243.1 TonB-dependent receptor [Flavobacterium agrisoli]